MRDTAVNVNGNISDAARAVVPVFDHGFLYGEGIYETLRTYNQVPFLLERHLQRLRASAAAINLEVPLTDDEIVARIDATCAAVSAGGERYIRLMVTRGAGDLSYDPRVCGPPTMIVLVKPFAPTPDAVRERGIAIVVSPVIRNHPAAIDPRIKSNNLLNNALAMQDALRRGAAEALMRNHRGEFSECSQSNFFLVRGGAVLTPPPEAGLLEGVTRDFVLEMAREAGVPARHAVLRDADLAAADEIFITSTTREVLAVTAVDGRPVGPGTPGPVTRTLTARFRARAAELVARGDALRPAETGQPPA